MAYLIPSEKCVLSLLLLSISLVPSLLLVISRSVINPLHDGSIIKFFSHSLLTALTLSTILGALCFTLTSIPPCLNISWSVDHADVCLWLAGSGYAMYCLLGYLLLISCTILSVKISSPPP